ncbi:hypothetical protein DZB91_08710 [Brevibacillus sp. VP]|nr:hypothetical protein DZB91_08710 [Brevibacillus sp. VP]
MKATPFFVKAFSKSFFVVCNSYSLFFEWTSALGKKKELNITIDKVKVIKKYFFKKTPFVIYKRFNL